jgi:hypothetical protein
MKAIRKDIRSVRADQQETKDELLAALESVRADQLESNSKLLEQLQAAHVAP